MQNAIRHPKAWCPPKKPKDFNTDSIPSLSGKIVLVTGATCDVGLEIAKALASARARVLVFGGKEDRLEDALEHIRQHCRDKGEHPHPDVHPVECNFSSLKDVKRAADALCEQQSHLDMIICTAGVGLQKFDLSEDGIDKNFAVTHLAHFLLINRLLPLLRHSPSVPAPGTPPPAPPTIPRIILLSSTLHTAASPSIHFLSYAELSPESAESSSPLGLHARAQLSTLLLAKRLARTPTRAPQSILTLAADPGPVHPEQPHQYTHAFGHVLGPAAKAVMAPFEHRPAEACLSALWAATASEVEEHQDIWQGAYVSAPGVAGEESAMARDEVRGEQLWTMSEALVRQRLGADALNPWIVNEA